MEIAEAAGENSNSEIRYSSLTGDNTLSLTDMKPRSIELCKDLFKNWSNKDESDFSIETVSAGGITNLLLKVSVREEHGNTINMTLRLYGPNTEYVINQERELQVLLRLLLSKRSYMHLTALAIQYLSAAEFGAKLLGVFGNGMVQSFLHARTLGPLDMRKPELAAKIAKQLRKFHQVDVPGSKEPQLWNDIFKFFKQASHLKFGDSEKGKKYETVNLKEIQTELVELQKLHFIDFEYGSYSYRGFDIGNHFNEYAGYDCDYSLYPNKDEQYHFFKHYLKPDKPQEISDKDLKDLYIETNCYIYWALWALIQARISPIDFDYLSYFFLRHDEYKRQKEKCLSTAKSYLSKYGT